MVLEVTLSVVLVTTAGLLVSSITQYWRLDWGFPMDRRLVAGITPSEATYATEAARLRFYTELLSRARQLPGVESAAVAGSIPVDMNSSFTRVAAEGSDRAQAAYRAVSPGYHETLGIALRRGRLFNDADRQGGAPVALVSESLARKLWPAGRCHGRPHPGQPRLAAGGGHHRGRQPEHGERPAARGNRAFDPGAAEFHTAGAPHGRANPPPSRHPSGR